MRVKLVSFIIHWNPSSSTSSFPIPIWVKYDAKVSGLRRRLDKSSIISQKVSLYQGQRTKQLRMISFYFFACILASSQMSSCSKIPNMKVLSALSSQGNGLPILRWHDMIWFKLYILEDTLQYFNLNV